MYVVVLCKNSNNAENYNNVSFYKCRSVQNLQSGFEIYLNAPFVWSGVTMLAIGRLRQEGHDIKPSLC